MRAGLQRVGGGPRLHGAAGGGGVLRAVRRHALLLPVHPEHGAAQRPAHPQPHQRALVPAGAQPGGQAGADRAAAAGAGQRGHELQDARLHHHPHPLHRVLGVLAAAHGGEPAGRVQQALLLQCDVLPGQRWRAVAQLPEDGVQPRDLLLEDQEVQGGVSGVHAQELQAVPQSAGQESQAGAAQQHLRVQRDPVGCVERKMGGTIRH